MVPIFRRTLWLAAIAATPAFGQSFEDLGRLDNRIAAALGAAIGDPGGATGPLDRRLHLAPCPQPAEIGTPLLGAVTVRCPSLGWRIRVPLAPGGAQAAPTSSAAATPVPPPVRAQPTIRRGDQVQLVAISGSFTVTTAAVADQDGGPGDRIRVRTENHPAPIIGQILADGRVALPGFN